MHVTTEFPCRVCPEVIKYGLREWVCGKVLTVDVKGVGVCEKNHSTSKVISLSRLDFASAQRVGRDCYCVCRCGKSPTGVLAFRG